MRRGLARLLVGLCVNCLLPAGFAQQAGTGGGTQAAPAKTAQKYTFNASTEIVLVNLTVRDSKGNLVKDLKKNDVTILEDGKPQSILSFDFEDVDKGLQIADESAGEGPAAQVIKGTGPTRTATAATPAPAPAKAVTPAAADTDSEYRDHRLVVMYFDLTTMQPEDVQSAIESAQNYVHKQMMPADLVAIAALGNSLQVVEDFTADKDTILRDLDAMNPASSAGFSDGLEAATDGSGVSTDGTVDDGSTFIADDTEFNVANADRSLEALMTIGQMLAPIQQKKSLLFFSDGITRSGTDNELTLRSAVNAMVKGNVSVYAVDARGLIAQVPGGNATRGSTRGASSFTGATVLSAINSTFSSQETLQNLANDTGGAFFLDSNDFAPAYTKIQEDTKAYYLISYSSSNHLKDGKYRKILVKLNRADLATAKVDARKGYYAPTDINHMSGSDKQAQLEDQLSADAPDQTLNLYATGGYLRLDKGRYYVPMSVVIPGNEIPLTGAKANSTPTVDFAGFVEDNGLRQIAHMNQNVPLNTKTAGDTKQLVNKNLQYDAGFVLTPGNYHIRMAARENQIGQMGSFETYIRVPNLDNTADPHALQVSSIMVGSQFMTAKPDPLNPLTASGKTLVLSVTKVFATNQHMYLYFEVYNPKLGADGKANIHVNAAFFQGAVRAFQTPIVTSTELSDPKREAVTIELDIPLSSMKPGSYTLQVNAVDELAQKYAFPRMPVLLRLPAQTSGGGT